MSHLLDGWPCIPGGISAAERAEIASYLQQRIDSTQAPSVRHFPDSRVRKLVLMTLHRMPRPLEAEEVARIVSNGSIPAWRVYAVLQCLVAGQVVSTALKTLSSGSDALRRAPIFWIESDS